MYEALRWIVFVHPPHACGLQTWEHYGHHGSREGALEGARRACSQFGFTQIDTINQKVKICRVSPLREKKPETTIELEFEGE